MKSLLSTKLAIQRRFFETHVVQNLLNALHRDRAAIAVSEHIRPIFIVGCGHSGTSLLCAILDSHPKLRAIVGENYVFWLWYSRQHVVRRFGRQFDIIAQEGQRPVEKTPRHIYVLRNILRFYPASRVLYLVRDPRGVACSIRKRTGSLGTGIRRWIADNGAADPVLVDSRLKVVRFEDMLQNTGKTLRDICTFLEIEFDDVLMKHEQQPRKWYGCEEETSAHAKRRFVQINSPIDPAFLNQWKNELSASDQARIEKSCDSNNEKIWISLRRILGVCTF